MVEAKRIFEDLTEDATFNFGELKLLYWKKTNKQGTSTVYNFIRECIDLKLLRRTQDGKFVTILENLRGLDEK